MSVSADDVDAIVASAAESGDSYYIDPEQGVIISGKKCSRCQYIKPLIAFHYKTKGKYGHQEWCKRCTRKKPPMSWADEYAEMQQEAAALSTSSSRNLRPGVGHMTQHGATGMADGVAADVDVIDEVNEVMEETATGRQFALEEGQMELGDWLKSDIPVFSSPLFTIRRSTLGDEGFTIYVNIGISIAPFIPTGDVTGLKTVELAARVIAGNTTGEPRVFGFGQK
jgi:hypothetical protein